MMTTTVDAEGRVTIPAPLRSKYGFTSGTPVVWIERDGELILRPMMPMRDLHGSLRTESGEPSLTALLLTERQRDRDREEA
jgi:AbrB family looped-hinge helix DNA binding protein